MKVWMPIIGTQSGSDVYFENLCRGLQDFGHQVILEKYPHHYEFYPWLIPSIPPDGIDLVHSNSWCAFPFKITGIPLVVTVHHCVHDPCYKEFTSWLQRIYHATLVKNYEALSFGRADAVVAVSQYTEMVVRTCFSGVSPVVIYNGIDAKHYHQEVASREGDAARPERLCKILSVANLSRRKAVDLYPSLLELLGQQFHIYVIGGIRAEGLKVSHPRLHFLGRLNERDLFDAYKSHDIFLTMSRYEGFGLSLAEAMAAGLPCVATRATAFPELIEDGVDGCLCGVNDLGSFANSVKAVWQKPVSERREMGRKGQDKVLREFSFNKFISSYDKLYQSLI